MKIEVFLEEIRAGVSDALDVDLESIFVSSVDDRVVIKVHDVSALVNDNIKGTVEGVINEIIEEP